MTNLEFHKKEIIEKTKQFGISCALISVYQKYVTQKCDISIILNWLCEEYRPKILTDKEHEYLSLVIEPFRDKVIDICKLNTAFNEFISIHVRLEDGNIDTICFPRFKENTQYIGMKKNHYYAPEQLNL